MRQKEENGEMREEGKEKGREKRKDEEKPRAGRRWLVDGLAG